MWCVSAGGHIAAGEGVVDAAIRECYEELGLKVKKSDIIKEGDNIPKRQK
jgi:8-oxo-dGTP pyrophosphatase MutT (NUDIX family)